MSVPGGGGPLVVLGASGLVGGELVRVARARGQAVLGAARAVLGEASVALDATDRGALERCFAEVSPRAVVICAAYSHVDGCEQNPDESLRLNVELVRGVIAALGRASVPVVFYSTDQIFDGSRDAHVESDPPHPLNVYARHKLAAEELLLRHGEALVVRAAWVFGEELRKKNFAYRVADFARRGAHLTVPRDQAGCPTSSHWLVESTLDLLDEGVRGVVHLTGGVPYSKAAWARTIAEGLGLPPLAVDEVEWSDAGQLAPRPSRVVLASERHRLVHPPVGTALARLRI